MYESTCSDCGLVLKEEFNFCPNCGSPVAHNGFSTPEVKIIDVLETTGGPLQVDVLAERTGLEVKDILVHLLTLELKSTVRQMAGKQFVLVKSKPAHATPKQLEHRSPAKLGEGIEPTPTSVTIEFRFSTSPSYEFAVEAAKKFEGYQATGRDKKVVHQVTVPFEEIESLRSLLEYLKGFRNRAVLLDGVKTLWDSVFSFMGCLDRKRESFKPELYCFGDVSSDNLNIVGCIHAMVPFNSYAAWCCYGRWLNEDGDWEFDKERIRFEIRKHLHTYKLCPALDLSRIEDFLAALPNIVNPLRDKTWKFVEQYGAENASGFKFKTERYGIEMTATAKGAAPNGKDAVLEIGKKLKIKLPVAII